MIRAPGHLCKKGERERERERESTKLTQDFYCIFRNILPEFSYDEVEHRIASF